MKILFIGSRLFDDVDYYLKEKGITSILTESNDDALNLDLADEVFIVPRGMEAPKQIAISNDVDAVIPLIGIDPPLLDVAIMKEELEREYGIPVIASDVRAVKLTSNKLNTKKFFDDLEINTPSYQFINDSSQLKLDFPLVLKQEVGQGGKDISVARSIEDVDIYLENFDKALCESFIEGSEISIEVLGYNGIFIPLEPIYKGETTIEGTHPLNKVKKGPLDIEEFDSNIVRETAYMIAKELNSDGIFEMDFIFDKINNKLYSLEINTRPNGTRYITTATSNINSLHELVNMAIGEFSEFNIDEKYEQYFSTEIPIGDYNGSLHSNPLKSFVNDNFVVHGPEGFKRITIRAKSPQDLNKLTNKLLNNN